MADERREPTPGDGPYRTAPLRALRRRRWIPWAVLGAAAALAVIAWIAWPSDDRARPSLGDIPAGLFDDARAWPAPEEELPPATPLAPLLVADAPDGLAVLSPNEGATRLRRNETLWVRFNRPMVAAAEVGRELAASPLVFEPPLRGAARWSSRSTLSFSPAPEAFPAEPRDVRLSFAPGLASLSGEPLEDELERVVVLDGAPRVSTYESQGRVVAGAPLPLVFDAPVSAAALRSELLAYEIGGGQRSLPLALSIPAAQPERGFRVDVRLGRALEPGARVGIAIAPRYLPWGGSSPGVLSYELAPRPHVEGVACAEGAAYPGQCTYRESPGRVIDIGPALRLLASARLEGASAANVRVSPPLRELRVRLAPHGPPQARLLEVEGEWEPDQVYEVRVSGLRTEAGEPVRALPPLAVRSSGHAPQIRVASGRLTYEREAEPALSFAAIHPSASDVLYRAVPAGEELRALVSPATFVREGGASSPLAPLAPDARANRWGRGRFAWRAASEGREEPMAVVAFRPDPSREIATQHTAFVQATDLGVTVRANADGLLVWVTRLSSAAPVRGARVTVADAQARTLAEATTDADGVARVDVEGNPLAVTHAVRVVAGGDRAALLLDPRRAVIPAAMGLTPGAPSGDLVATVLTDRGAYRPGEGLHAKVLLRRVEGARARAVRTGRFVARLHSASGTAPVAERPFSPSRYGTASVDFDIPRAAQLGLWRLEVVEAEREGALGAVDVRVAEYRQPTFRVDVGAIGGPVLAGETVEVEASATYLFGAPVTSGRLAWSLVRAGEAPHPERWSRYTFRAAGAAASFGTVAAGEEALGASGAVRLAPRVELAAGARTALTLEAAVTDGAGHTHAARRSFVAYPAAVEVGVRRGADWIGLGAPLELEAIVIDHDGAPVAGHAVEARVLREGWHSWWEWSQSSRGARDGGYQLRRDQRREEAHRCALRSAAEPVRCDFTPSRPGTYVLEAEVRGEDGRAHLASRRVYVAGPDEQPDRDPPGAPIAVTPTRARWTVGETAELAFESPFERAEALVTVEREGVLHVERRSVGAGGQVIRVPVREDMIPNVAVGVTLVAPRTGAPGAEIDLGAPDLRFGVAELTVAPPTLGLSVTLDLPASARPGGEVPIAVRVTDEGGRPVAGEVALWAVDEGTLRLTGYQVPDPTSGLFRPRPVAFAWEDLRRALVSRVQPPPMPAPSGDGGEGQARRTLDDRERFDPTPLWLPALQTDAEGRASATLTLPERPTEYRVMAVAIDAGARSGRASAQLVAEQPLVIRPALPSFVTAGDRFEASVFVHNATDAALEARVWATVAGERRVARAVTIPAGGEVRVAEPITAPAEGPLAIRFDAEAGGEGTAARGAVPVSPRGRFVRSQVFAAAVGSRELIVGLPEGTPRAGGRVGVTVASHPFVGLEGAVDALTDSRWAGVEATASALLGLCAYAELAVHGIPEAEVAARGRERAAELLALSGSDHGFGRWSPYDGALPRETALGVHALGCARARGWLTEGSALERARERLGTLASGAAFADWYGEAGLDENAYALRVLAELEAPEGARAGALHEQRDRLSPYGLAQLAMALGPDDARSDTLVADAVRQVLATREDEARDPSALRFGAPSARTLGAVLEAASRSPVGHARIGEVAGALLALRGGAPDRPWGGSLETARALFALAAYARLWRWGEGEAAHVSLDGSTVPATVSGRGGAYAPLPFEALRGTHRLRVRGGDEGPVFFVVDGRFAVPLGEHDELARGRRAALHRVYETADGRPLPDGAAVPLGALVRVRLFVHTEETAPEMVLVHDPLPAGFEAIDAADETSPRASLMALMGTSADDDVVDARAHHAMRSIGSIAHRAFATEAASFYLERLPTGLAEYTYAIRATTVGDFTAPPAQLEAMYDPAYVARSAVARLRVVEPEAR